ncbi:uncharacterized protein [Centruroides vittatus]|uniref:uncharacterized protein n=1 Tax=Centruroides vittatus TaxID=120091 RepID=UPI00350FAC79
MVKSSFILFSLAAVMLSYSITVESSRVDIAQCFFDNIPKKIKTDYEQCYEKARGRYGLKIREALMCVMKTKKLLTENGDVDMESYKLTIGDIEDTKYGKVSSECESIVKVKQFISCILVGLVRSCNPDFSVSSNSSVIE